MLPFICPLCEKRSVPNKWSRIPVKMVECQSCKEFIEIRWVAGRLYRRKADDLTIEMIRKELSKLSKDIDLETDADIIKMFI